MMFVLDRRTYDILFSGCMPDDLTQDELDEADADLLRIRKALDAVMDAFREKGMKEHGKH